MRRPRCARSACAHAATWWETTTGVAYCAAHLPGTVATRPTLDGLTTADAQLWDYALEETGPSSWRLTPPGGGEMESVRVAELPGPYIVIYGDLCPSMGRGARNGGVISETRKNLAWFTRGMSPSYLASKFLRESFRRDLALDACRERATEAAADPDLEEEANDWDDLVQDAEACEGDGPDTQVWFEDRVREIDPHAERDAWYGYDPRDEELLAAIQRRFSLLWHARHNGILALLA